MSTTMKTSKVREPVMLEIKPLGTPARDLPFGMAYDVCQVLKAYGLDVLDGSLEGQGMVAVQLALVRVIQSMPPELGGRNSRFTAESRQQ